MPELRKPLAQQFFEIAERLCKYHGLNPVGMSYEELPDTKNNRLLIAVCEELERKIAETHTSNQAVNALTDYIRTNVIDGPGIPYSGIHPLLRTISIEQQKSKRNQRG